LKKRRNALGANMKKGISSKSLFIVVLVLSILTILLMLFPEGMSVVGPNILFLWGLLGLSGVGLIVMTKKEKAEAGKIKYFLFAAGFSATGIVLGIVLHNALYAIGTLLTNLPVLSAVIGFLEGFFFLFAVILCPLGLIIGLLGTILMWKQF